LKIIKNPLFWSGTKNQVSSEVTGKSVEADSSVCELTSKLQLLNSEIKSKELEISHIKQTIMGQMGEAELLTYQGKILATWKSPKQSYRLDSKRLEIEHPELIPQYQVAIQNSRRLVIKESLTPTHKKSIVHTGELA